MRIPLPNSGAPGALANNWTANFPGNTGFTHYDHFDFRGDYNATEPGHDLRALQLAPAAAHRARHSYPLYRLQDRHGQSTVLAWNHTISPSAFNEFRFGTTYHRNHYTANVIGSDLMQPVRNYGRARQPVR